MNSLNRTNTVNKNQKYCVGITHHSKTNLRLECMDETDVNEEEKFMRKKAISLLLILCMVVMMLSTTAFATSDKGDLASAANTQNAMEIVYGGQSWRVISYNGIGAVGEAGTMTLLAKGMIGVAVYDINDPLSNAYAPSNLRTVIDSIANGFNPAEKAAIATHTLDGVYGPVVLDALLWPLSVDEAGRVDGKLRDISNPWWLRSPGSWAGDCASYVEGVNVFTGGAIVSTTLYVRPTFKLKLASILFSSDASGGKSGMAGDNLEPVAAPNGAQKLTMLDSTLSLGAVTQTAISGRTLTLSYTGATPGKTLSAVVVNSAGAVTNYGKLIDSIVTADGSATVTLPAGFDSNTMKLKVFTETINGDNLTDYASTPVDVTVTLPVTNISGVPTTAETGVDLTLIGTVEPADATNKTIVWSIKDAGTTGASIVNGNILKTTAAGTAVITATIINGESATTNYSQEFSITAQLPCAVTYNGNGSTSGGLPTDGSSPYFVGATVTVLGNTGGLVKTGYAFADWNTAADGGGTSYAAGATFPMGTEAVTLYAQWTEGVQTITYNANGSTGGSAPTDLSTYAIGATATVLDNFGGLVKTGYTFSGWSTSSTAREATYIAGSPIKMTENMTLYAVWIPYTYTSDGTQITITGYTGTETVVTVPVTVANLPVKVIGDNAFKDKTAITTVSLPNGLITVGKYAFQGCSALTSVNIPSSVTSLGEGAFYLCTKLPSIVVPSSVTSLGAGAFSNCIALTNVNIPSSITAINMYTFDKCTSLTSVTIPSSVTVLGEGVFRDCTALTSIDIPSGVTGIPKVGFQHCAALTSVNIPSSVTYIDEQAFVLCSALTRVTIPSSVTYIGRYAFSADSKLTTVMFKGNAPVIGTYVFNNAASGFKILYYKSKELGTVNWSTPTWNGYAAYPLNVVYDANGGTEDVPIDNTIYSNGDTVTVSFSPLPTRTGYTFAGWAASASATSADYTSGGVTTFTKGAEDVTLYAVWTALPTYTVTYDANGGTSGNVPSDSASPYLAGATVTVLGNTGTPALAKTGYSFAGWNTAANGSGTPYAAGATFPMGAAAVTLYAQWTALSPSLTFTGASGFWQTTFAEGGTTCDLIRYGNNTFLTANDFVTAMNITSGYVEVYDKSGNLLRNTKNGSTATSSTAIVSTGATIRLCDDSDAAVKTYTLVMKGDINGDGFALGNDVIFIKRIVAGTYTSSVYEKAAADTTGDGFILGTDAILLKRYIAVPSTATVDQTK